MGKRLPAPPAPRRNFKTAPKKEWAHVVDVNKEIVNVSGTVHGVHAIC